MVSQYPPALLRAHTLTTTTPKTAFMVSYRHNRPDGLTITSRPPTRSHADHHHPENRLYGLISSQPPRWSHSNSPLSPSHTYPTAATTAPHDIRELPFDGLNATCEPSRLCCLCLCHIRAAKRGGGLHARIRCVWQSATYICCVSRLNFH